MGLIYATGAAQAAPHSLMCGKGVNLKLVRQDDVGRMQENLIAFATALKEGEVLRPELSAVSPLRRSPAVLQRTPSAV